MPEPATNHVLYAQLDPANAIAEFDEANNTQSLKIGGVDLAVSLLSYGAMTNGSLRVTAQVQNLGAPSATNSTLAIRRYGDTNAPLATASIPLLEPGRLAQVALDLPAGTQPEGEQIYTIRADDTGATSDVDTNNNVNSFAVNLWLDTDGDGMPEGWETANGLNPNGSSDSSKDDDGDGVSNLAEYRAGTNPQDAMSYLRIQSLVINNANEVQVTWGSASNRLYSIQRASVLTGGTSFTNIAENIFPTPQENVFIDTTATNAKEFFYRLKVQ